MVMQSKVFLICLLQKYSPLMCKKKTIIRRFSESVRKRMSHNGSKEGEGQSSSEDDMDDSDDLKPELAEMTQTRAMRLFTKLPFPEPKRVTKLRPRVLE